MRLFICWSGERSKRLATALCGWLPKVVHGVDPFLSSDIPKGSLWFETIASELNTAGAGLICMTPENLDSKWIHFEAGALAKSFHKNNIYTYLFRVNPSELAGPLGVFQHTESTKSDTKMLMKSIASSIGMIGPSESGWEQAFDQGWPELEKVLDDLDQLAIQFLMPEFEELFQRKTFNEPLNECSQGNWIDRYYAARETLDKLKRNAQRIRDKSPAYLSDVYEELISQLDGYAMDLRAYLLKEEEYKLGPDGYLVIFPGIVTPCERRRKRIKQLLLYLLSPECAPILDDARRFEKFTTFAEKKILLIHPYQRRIENGEELVSKDNWERTATSSWDFDRIVYYLIQESHSNPDIANVSKCIHQELEKLEAKDGSGSEIPLHYAIRALLKSLSKVSISVRSLPELRNIIGKVERYQAKTNPDTEGPIKDNITAIQERLKALSPDAAS